MQSLCLRRLGPCGPLAVLTHGGCGQWSERQWSSRQSPVESLGRNEREGRSGGKVQAWSTVWCGRSPGLESGGWGLVRPVTRQLGIQAKALVLSGLLFPHL